MTLVLLLKRKPGMSLDDFKVYYESHHAPLGVSVMPLARRYIRRYLEPASEEMGEPPYDVLTEVWFDSRADYDQTIADLVASGAADRLREDEAKLFLDINSQMIVVEETETDCTVKQDSDL